MLLADLKKKLENEMSGHDTAHYAGRALAAIGPIEEWLKELAKHGYDYVVIPREWWNEKKDLLPPPPISDPISLADKEFSDPIPTKKNGQDKNLPAPSSKKD